ncbi:MAG: hypothetical protein A2521_14835 [Deltaproteobacteria bacterium RIFOXYD12_FULL_57_12]|nr:MAG: hypothetical protein A2521_14835 [Deltaproteobacteria bacterium RIFOXYD12_FULL_57_12]
MSKVHNHFVDPDKVEHVTKRLHIDHEELFAEAYHAWFGEQAAGPEIAACVEQYLAGSNVPFWVRSHVRALLGEQQRSRKDVKKKLLTTAARPLPFLIYAAYTMGLCYALLPL